MLAIKKHDGFTLIEILVSIILIPLVWFAISISLSVNAMLISQSKHRAQAVFVAQQELDRLRTSDYTTLASVSNVNVTIDTRGTTTTGDDLIGKKNIVVQLETSPLRHYRQVTATISWSEKILDILGTRTLTESLATIISDDPAG